MLTSKSRALLAATAVAATAVVFPAMAEGALIGQVCNTNSYAIVITTGGSYSLPAGAGFRIEGYGTESYFGHGNQMPSGYLSPRSLINQSTCHF